MYTRRMNLLALIGLVSILLAGSRATMAQDGETEQEQKPLYHRVGGLAPISVVVSDFIDALVPDPMLNENPAIAAARKVVPAPYLKYHVTAMMCEATGGP